MTDNHQPFEKADPPPPVQHGHVAKRRRKCRFCPLLVASGDALQEHEADCGGSQDLNKPRFLGAMPIGIGDCGMVTFFAAGMSADVSKALTDLLHRPYMFGKNGRVRPYHRGFMRAYGRCDRTGAPYIGTSEIQTDPCLSVFEEKVMSHPLMLHAELGIARLKLSRAFPDLHIVLPKIGRCNYFFTKNYMAVDATVPGDAQRHSPPPGVAAILGVESCKQTCPECKVSCDHCTRCCLHYDVRDRSLGLLLLWQPLRTPLKERCFFELDGKAIRICGGLSLMFHGGQSLHGLWAPPVVGDRWSWFGALCVIRNALSDPHANDETVRDRTVDKDLSVNNEGESGASSPCAQTDSSTLRPTL